ncbi:hypothetical protein MBANPS3_009128 [Mucor bainieri]
MKLPPEIIEKIFTESNMTKSDLLQLQLTCKHWSPIAEKALYTSINLGDEDFNYINLFTPEVDLKRAKLLIRTLERPNSHNRFWVQTIHLGQMLGSHFNNISQDPHFNIALLAHLCPNIRTVSTKSVTIGFYQFLTQLHCDGYLQHLQNICWPELTESFDYSLWISYYITLKESKGSVKDILILDPSNNGVPHTKAIAKKHSITPDTLQNFAKLESLHVLEFTRMKLHQLENYIQQCVSQLRRIEINMKDATGMRDEGSVIMSVAQPQQQVIQLEIMFNEPISHKDMLLNGPLDDASDSIDLAMIYQFLEYLFTITHVDFDEIHLNVNSIPQIIHFVARSIQVKTVRFSALDPMGQDQGLISLQHQLKDPKTSRRKSEQIETHSCQFEVALISHAPQMLFCHILNVFKAGEVERLILGPQYIQDSSLPLQITQHMIDAILGSYLMLKSLIFTLVEFPEDAPAISTPERTRHFETLALQNCVVSSNYLAELSRRIEHVDELRYLDSNVDQYYLNNENAKINVHMPHTTFTTINLMFPAIKPYLVQITTSDVCLKLKTSREQGLELLSSEEYSQLEKANDAYQVDVVCNAVSAITTNYGSFNV